MKTGILVLLASLSLHAENISGIMPELDGGRRPKKQSIEAQCVDFNGTWEGECYTSQRVQYHIKTHIDQKSCDKVVWDTSAVMRDLTTTQIKTKDNVKVSSSVTLDWRNNQSDLVAVETILKREMDSSYMEGVLSYVRARMRPSNQRITLEGKSANLAFGTTPVEGSVEFNCYLDLR